jgi:hypothetical protein
VSLLCSNFGKVLHQHRFPQEGRMADVDLRPLSLGEILDRTFTLYRRNFLLFVGIVAIPHVLILALNLVQVFVIRAPRIPARPVIRPEQLQSTGASGGLLAVGVVGVIVAVIVYIVAYLFAQGGTVWAVSDLYLGKPTSIGASLKKMKGELASLSGVIFFNALAIGGATILLIIPGIYMACRLLPCVPASLLENLGPFASLDRSFRLTKGFAGRAFVIYLLYFVLLYAAILLFMMPFALAAGVSVRNPEMYRFWLALAQVGNVAAAVLISPILTIATAVFYFDLRVRKEAFDLQYMMNPATAVAAGSPGGSPGVPTMLS